MLLEQHLHALLEVFQLGALGLELRLPLRERGLTQPNLAQRLRLEARLPVAQLLLVLRQLLGARLDTMLNPVQVLPALTCAVYP